MIVSWTVCISMQKTRLEIESPIIGELYKKMPPASLNLLDLTVISMLLEGARVEGAELTSTLIEASGFEKVEGLVILSPL